MHNNSIQIEHMPACNIVMNQLALHCYIIALSCLNIAFDTLCVSFNVIRVPILSGSTEDLYTYEGMDVWELFTRTTGARTGHVLFCKIPLKLFICTKVLRMGLSRIHNLKARKTS